MKLSRKKVTMILAGAVLAALAAKVAYDVARFRKKCDICDNAAEDYFDDYADFLDDEDLDAEDSAEDSETANWWEKEEQKEDVQ
jgi:hypothetical protein